jgi:hypothetical protein
MADWTNLPDSTFDEGKPIRSVDGLALRDNPAAIARGAPGAPRITPWATVVPVTAGGNLRYNDQGPHGGQPLNDMHPVVSATVFCQGTLSVQTQTIRPSAGTTRAQIRRVRGLATTSFPGSAWEHSANSGDTTKVWAVDIDVEPGDALQLMMRNSGGVAPRAGYFRLRTGGEFFWALGSGSLVMPVEPS